MYFLLYILFLLGTFKNLLWEHSDLLKGSLGQLFCNDAGVCARVRVCVLFLIPGFCNLDSLMRLKQVGCLTLSKIIPY